MTVRPEYFATGLVPHDDDEHREQVAAGRIPQTCRLGGPSLATLFPVVASRNLVFCDLCPYTQRELCGGTPKPVVSPLDSVRPAELKDIDLSLTDRIALRMKRDAARTAILEGISTTSRARKGLKS